MEAIKIGKRSRQVQHDATHRRNHVSSEFQKRSRNVETCARTEAVPARPERSSCINT